MLGLRAYLAAAMIVAVLAGFGGAYLLGRHDGAAQVEADAYKTILKEQGIWDDAENDAADLDAYRRCLGVSRVPDDCAVLLRGQEAAEGE